MALPGQASDGPGRSRRRRVDRRVPVDPASQKGLLRKHYCCPGCGKQLEGGANGRVQARRVLELKGLEPFGVIVELPKFHCPTCGRECVPPGVVVVGDLMKASARAFRAGAVSAA